jgi:acyl dehydratase
MGLFAVGETNKMLDAWAGRTTYTANAAVWAKLHIGDPGSAGSNNAAANTSRQQVTFGAAAAAGAMSNTAVVEWLSVSNTETYSHVSFWTANAAGTFLGSDDLSSTAPVTAGDTFRIPVGDLDLALPGV